MGKFPRITTLQITAEIQNMLTEIKRESEQFQGRIVFVTLFNDTVSRENGNKELWIANFLNLAEYARSFAHGHWSFLWPQLFPSISLSIYGAAADMCEEPAWEISKCSEGTWRDP